MEDNSEMVLKKICCTCLSRDRKLFQLCRISNGVNNLYLLLSYDSEAFREGFYKDTASFFICWECRAILSRIARFRQQACVAQRQLSLITDGQLDITSQKCLSRLSKCSLGNKPISSELDSVYNFIDCGPNVDVKTESDDDIPLSELHSNVPSENEEKIQKNCTLKELKPKKRRSKKECYFITAKMSEDDLKEVRLKKRKMAEFVDSFFKCDSCLEVFKWENDLVVHSSTLHVEKPGHIKCDICLVFTKEDLYQDHRDDHYTRYNCLCCEFVSYEKDTILSHLEVVHHLKWKSSVKQKKGRRKSVTKSIENPSLDEKITSHFCKECNKYFDNKNQRWKHTQRYHKEGHKCATCGKRFAFKSNLARHALLHSGPPPRTECPVCHKSIRVDLLKTHSRIHSQRERYSCVECSKSPPPSTECPVCHKSIRVDLLKTHSRTHSQRERYSCVECSKSPPPRTECPVCHKSIRVDLLKTHSRIHSQRERYSCVECSKSFVSRASYEHHLKYTQKHAASNVLKHKCSLCEKGYRSKGELRDHVNYQHMRQTQHKCPVCGKALASRRCITRHVRRAHEGIKESARDKICQQCGKAFRDKKGVREHELTHTGERPLSCELCGCTFRQSASLYTHRKRVHNIYPTVSNIQIV